MTKRKRDPFKRFIRITNLNKNKDFDNHLVSVVNKMIEKGQNKIDTPFKTFNFTIERIEMKIIYLESNEYLVSYKFLVSNKYYGISSVYKFN